MLLCLFFSRLSKCRFRESSKAYQEEFENTKVIIRSRKSKKSEKYTVMAEKKTKNDNDIQNTIQKAADRITRVPLKRG
jgi:hypothetical protein